MVALGQLTTTLRSNAAQSAYPSSPVYKSDASDSFVGSGYLGIGVLCYSGEGQVNGMPPSDTYIDEGGYAVTPTRTLGVGPNGEQGYGIFA